MTARWSWATLACAVAAHAAFDAPIPCAAEVASGEGQVARAATGGALESNPALAASGGWRAGAGSTHPYGIDALELSGFWAGRGRAGWVPGWQARWKLLRAGNLYREDQIALDLAHAVGNWQVGAGWRGGRSELEGEVPDWIHGLALGATFAPNRLVAVGIAWEDLSALAISDSRLARPWTLRSGVAAVPFDSAWVSRVGMEYRQREPVRWSFGQEMRWGVLALRAGFGVQPWVLAFGAGVRWNGIGIDWAQEGDPRLGWQQHWSISVER